jgi:hypothetical protein
LRDEEAAIVRKMVSGTAVEARARRQLAEALVQDMSDGGMGSIQFCCQSSPGKRLFAEEIGEGSFRDSDGVLVSVTLNADQFGDLFELDLWKVDFSRLNRYPDPADFEVIERHGQLGYPPTR